MGLFLYLCIMDKHEEYTKKWNDEWIESLKLANAYGVKLSDNKLANHPFRVTDNQPLEKGIAHAQT